MVLRTSQAFHQELKSGGPWSSTLFHVPVSTWYENDTRVSFLSALLPYVGAESGEVHVRDLARLQKLGDRRELLP